MGLIATILDFLSVNRNNANINDVTVKSGGNYNITAEQYIAIDKQPLKTDYAFLVQDSGTGRHVVLGYIDPINTNEANEGEEGLKGRSPEGGAVVCRVFVRNDGSVQINNENGNFVLNPNGDFNLNGVIIDTQGNITTPASISASLDISSDTSMTAPQMTTNSIVADGKELSNHTHPAGTPPGNTGANN